MHFLSIHSLKGSLSAKPGIRSSSAAFAQVSKGSGLRIFLSPYLSTRDLWVTSWGLQGILAVLFTLAFVDPGVHLALDSGW